MFAFIWKRNSPSPNGSGSCLEYSGSRHTIYFFQVSVMHHFYNPGPRRHLFAFVSAWIKSMTGMRVTDLFSIYITFTESWRKVQRNLHECWRRQNILCSAFCKHLNAKIWLFLRSPLDYDKPRTILIFQPGVAKQCWLILMWDAVILLRMSVLLALMILISTAPDTLFLTYHPKFFSTALRGALLPPKTLTSKVPLSRW